MTLRCRPFIPLRLPGWRWPAVAVLVGVAGVRLTSASAPQVLEDALDTRTGWDLEADGAADRSAGASVNGVTSGRVGLSEEQFSAVHAFSAEPTLAVDFGVRGAALAIAADPAVPLPAHLASIGLATGFVWKPGKIWGISAEALPAFSGQGGATSRTLNVSGVVTGYWLVAPRVLLEAGVEFDSLGKYPLYPSGGAVVDLSPQWSLRLLFPQSRLVYQATAAWAVYAGANVEVQSFRVDGRFGTAWGYARLNHAALSIEETEFGPGTSYQWGPAAYLELNVGAVSDRHLDFFRAGRSVDLRNALALRLTVEISF